jgi:hypothetical protein
MKKTGLYLLTLLALGFASCDDHSDLGVEQKNPQENIMQANGVTLAYATPVSGSAIDLTSYKGESIPVITLVEATDLPEDAAVSYEMQVASSDSYSDAVTLAVTDDAVSADQWDAAFKQLIGNTPAATPNYMRFAVYVTDGSQKSRLGGLDFWYAAKQIDVTPYNLGYDVEASYIFNGDVDSFVMDHSPRHQWDDPEFSYIFDVTNAQASAGYKWSVKTEGGRVYGVSATGDNASLTGSLVEGGVEGLISAAGKYKITVNMLDLTYSISYAFETIYTPGNANGWGDWNNQMLLRTTDYKNYWGYVYIETQFKISADTSWSVNWGLNDGILTKDGNNIVVDNDGLYWVSANLNDLTLTYTPVTSIGVIGDLNSWSAEIPLTPSADYKTWSGEVTFPGGGGWKFRSNDDWGINLGGDTMDNLVLGGANIADPGAGTYVITLDISSYPYTCTAVAK